MKSSNASKDVLIIGLDDNRFTLPEWADVVLAFSFVEANAALKKVVKKINFTSHIEAKTRFLPPDINLRQIGNVYSPKILEC